jgi:hypothetical protein
MDVNLEVRERLELIKKTGIKGISSSSKSSEFEKLCYSDEDNTYRNLGVLNKNPIIFTLRLSLYLVWQMICCV